MSINIPYDKTKDRTFYKNPSDSKSDIIIGKNHFAIFFPQDGHSPQHFVEAKTLIKKLTIKIKL